MEIDIKVKFDKESLVGLLSTATYGSDWLEIRTLKEEKDLDGETEFESREDRWANRLFKGGHVLCIDHYDDEEDPGVHKLSLDSIERAFNNKDCFQNVVRFVDGSYDITDAENIIQCAMFGEVVYG